MEININFKHYRELAHLSQKEAAEQLGIPSYVLSNYELGRSEPKLETLIKMCYLYKCDANQLLGITLFKIKQSASTEKMTQEKEELNRLLEDFVKEFKLRASQIIEKK